MPRANSSGAVFDPTTAAATAYFSLDGSEIPARLTVTNLAGSETCAIYAVDGPSDVTTALYKDGVAVTAKATDPVLLIDAPGNYYISKTVTATASGAYLTKGN